jgi:hypothetical protein
MIQGEPGVRRPSFVDLCFRLFNFVRLLLGPLQELVQARGAAKLILLPVHDPIAPGVGLVGCYRTNLIARLKFIIMRSTNAPELLGGHGVSVCLNVHCGL